MTAGGATTYNNHQDIAYWTMLLRKLILYADIDDEYMNAEDKANSPSMTIEEKKKIWADTLSKMPEYQLCWTI